jgi:hypothetical protein
MVWYLIKHRDNLIFTFNKVQTSKEVQCGTYVAGQGISVLCSDETGSEVHPTSSVIGTGGSFPGIKWQEREADQSSPSSDDVKTDAAIPPIPYASSWRGA